MDWTVTELEKRDVVYIEDVDALPDHLIQPLAHILAWRAAPEFGAASDPALASLAAQAEIFIKKMEWNGPDYTILKGQYF